MIFKTVSMPSFEPPMAALKGWNHDFVEPSQFECANGFCQLAERSPECGHDCLVRTGRTSVPDFFGDFGVTLAQNAKLKSTLLALDSFEHPPAQAPLACCLLQCVSS